MLARVREKVGYGGFVFKFPPLLYLFLLGLSLHLLVDDLLLLDIWREHASSVRFDVKGLKPYPRAEYDCYLWAAYRKYFNYYSVMDHATLTSHHYHHRHHHHHHHHRHHHHLIIILMITTAYDHHHHYHHRRRRHHHYHL